MSKSQLTTPLVIRNGRAAQLQRVPFGETGFTESWLQELLYLNPSLLPIDDIEALFGKLIPLARELPTNAGFIDLVFINREGLLTLVETKLWRNPEARRQVVAQIVDYAKEMGKWTYEELTAAASAARPELTSSEGLFDLVAAIEGADALDEAAFIDNVTRNLRRARFLLLIVGDGIHEGVQQMADFLQQTPQLGFTLALTEIGVFRTDAEDELFIQPRILARTQEVVRAIVEINVSVPPTSVRVSIPEKVSPSKGRQPLTEEEFLTELQQNDPEVVELARWVLSHAEEYGFTVDWGGGGPKIQFSDTPSGEAFTLAQLHKSGCLDSLWSLPYRCGRLGLPERLWRDYWSSLTTFFPGAAPIEKKNKYGESFFDLVDSRGGKRRLPLRSLVDHRDEWFRFMQTAADRIKIALSEL